MICQIILLILWVPTYAPADPIVIHADGSAGDDQTCLEDECEEMANTIRRQMGYKQPCDDFYNYVCGNWSGERELRIKRLKKKAVLTLADLLANATVESTASNATKKLVLAYRSCVQDRGEEALKRSIGNVIRHYNLDSEKWPIINDSVQSPSKRSNGYVEILKKTGPRPVFSYSVTTKNSTPIIIMTKPSDFYSSLVLKLDSRTISDMGEGTTVPDYSEYEDYEERLDNAYKTFIMETIALVNKSISNEDVQKVVNNIVELEKGLFNLSESAKKEEEQAMNLSQLSKLLGDKIRMSEILQRDFEGLDMNITEETKVLVQYADYYKAAVEFLECRSIVDITNYILWTTIRKMAEARGTPLHKVYVDYKHNTTVDGSPEKDLENTTTLSVRCVRQLLGRNVLYTGSAHYYIKAKFNESDREDVLKIMEFVNSSFMHVVKNNTWMSEHTKREVTLKLQKTESIIGYPYWMLNETIIDGLYNFVPEIQDNASFVEHFYYLLENDHKQTLLQLDPDRYFNKMNEDVPFISLAHYHYKTDTMVYPAAAILTHYRRSPIPRSVNYGTIGTILAKLFSILIERYYDLANETRTYKADTWDNTTKSNFCNRSSCLNHTEECSDTQVPSTEKYEKIIDYFGVRISYQAMENSKKNYSPPFLLRDDNNAFDSEEKIFFTVFGSLTCPFSVNEKKVESRMDEADYPKKLNEIVYNYEEFNKTFNCTPLGKDACDLMPPQPVYPVSC